MIAALLHRVTAPRQILPGTTYLITRRCAQRQFLLRPSKNSTQVFLFVLGVAARLYGMQLHAYCVMSNHYHLVLTDLHARLPAFQQFLNAFVARAINRSFGRWETFWGPGSFSAVTLASPEDIVRETAYTLANPVKAGLVRTGRLWPGAWSDPDRIDARPIELERPDRFFDGDGDFPETAELELTTPPGFASAAEFRENVVKALEQLERDAEKHFGSRGFRGIAAVLKQDPMGRPRSVEPRRGLNPRVAAKDTRKRIEVLGRLKAFLNGYRAALREWRAGKLDVEFPAGTYLMRVMHGAPCAAVG